MLMFFLFVDDALVSIHFGVDRTQKIFLIEWDKTYDKNTFFVN